MSNLAQTLEAMKAARQQPLPDVLAKSFTQSTGLVNYDLQAPALLLFPVLTPLRNKIPRVSGDGGTATVWKQITSINPTNMRSGVSEGNRGGVIVDATSEKTAAYRGIGLENSVTFEAQYAAAGFDDAKAKAVLTLLSSVMVQEEQIILGGNGTNGIALGVTPTPAVATATTGGTLAAATYNVICVALTLANYKAATVTGGIPITANRTNADGTVDSIKGGHAGKSAAASQATTGATSTISATVNASTGGVNGAVAYAWFWGTAGNELLGAITTINSVLITATATGTQNASAVAGTDESKDALVFEGLLTQIMTSGSGAYNVALPTGTAGTGTVLTSDLAGGCVQIETALTSFWDNARLSPDEMWMSAAQLISLNTLIIKNGGAPLIRMNLDGNGGGMTMIAGTVVGSYLNKVTNKLLKIGILPDMPNGMILFYSNSVPYPISNVNNILQIKTRQDYYQTEWPLRTRKYEFGVYADELLQLYFAPGFGVLRNIAV